MKDVFYTILLVWLIFRIMNGFSSFRYHTSGKKLENSKYNKKGETTVDFVPPKKKAPSDDEGEYVDYEEIK